MIFLSNNTSQDSTKLFASVAPKDELITTPPSCLYIWPLALNSTELVANRNSFVKFSFVRLWSGAFYVKQSVGTDVNK